MSFRSLEVALRNELAGVIENRRLRVKDLLVWSTSEGNVREAATCATDTVVFCPQHKVWVCIDKTLDKRGSTA